MSEPARPTSTLEKGSAPIPPDLGDKLLVASHSSIPRDPPSLRLRVVSSLFLFFGAGLSVQLVMMLLFTFTDSRFGLRGMGVIPLLIGAVTRAITAIGYLWTARELRRRSRAAWIAAMIAVGATLIPSWRPVSLGSVGIAIIGLLILASVRGELDDASSKPEDND